MEGVESSLQTDYTLRVGALPLSQLIPSLFFLILKKFHFPVSPLANSGSARIAHYSDTMTLTLRISGVSHKVFLRTM
jgi:hypothetical protein